MAALPLLPGLEYAAYEILTLEAKTLRETLQHLASCQDCSRTLDITEAALVVNPSRIKGTRNYEWVKKLMSTFLPREHYSVRQIDYFLRHLRRVINSSTDLQEVYSDDEEANVECIIFQTKIEREDNKWQCLICLENFQDSQEIAKVKCCQHVFHDCCFREWYNHNYTCPLCREDLRKKHLFDWCIYNMNFST